jgi:hypothetical protein
VPALTFFNGCQQDGSLLMHARGSVTRMGRNRLLPAGTVSAERPRKALGERDRNQVILGKRLYSGIWSGSLPAVQRGQHRNAA